MKKVSGIRIIRTMGGGSHALFLSYADLLNSDDAPLKKSRKDSVTFLQALCIMLNSYIVTSPLRNYRQFKYGFFFVLITNVISALLSFYSVWITVRIMKKFRTFTYEDSWKACGLKMTFYISLSTFLSCSNFVAYYIQTVQTLWKELISYWLPSAPSFITDYYFVALSILAVFIIPAGLKTNLKFSFFFMALKACLIFLLYVFVLYEAIHSTTSNGFNPQKVVKPFFNFESGFVIVISENVSAYSVFMLTYLVINHMLEPTFSRCVSLIKWTFMLDIIISLLFGATSYFIFYNEATDNFILSHMNTGEWPVTAAYAAFILSLVFSIPPLLFPAQENILSLVATAEVYPSHIWLLSAIFVVVVSIFLGSFSGTLYDIVFRVQSACTAFMQFIAPSIMMFTQMKEMSWYHWPGAIALLLLGTFYVVYVIIYG